MNPGELLDSSRSAALTALFALPWLLPFLSLPRLSRRRPNLLEAPMASGRLVSVIVPARNEAAGIETVCRSVLASTYHPLELLVVDDRSNDDTRTLVRRLAEADPRVRLVVGDELPRGWIGKPWACYQGYRAARGDLLVFTDADTLHAPGLLGHAVGALLSVPADLLTISPRQRCITFWERVVMPQIWLLLGLRYHPSHVNRATRARDVIANGQFILVTRAAYERAGTHQAVKGEVAEDLSLAQVFLRAGAKLHFSFAETLMETRMYRGLPQLIEGWSKNIYLGARRSYPDEPLRRAIAPILPLVAMGFWLLPLLVLPLALAVGPGLLTGALGAIGASALFWMVICLGMRIPPWYGLAYPAGAAVTFYIIARSVSRGGREIEWKGRVYRRRQ